MGGVCSARRNGERSPRSAGEGGAPPSYFDVVWEESDGEVPVSNAVSGSRSGGLGGSGNVAARADGHRGAGRAEASPRRGEARRISDGPKGSSPMWPILAKEHLSLLYSNEEWCRPSVDGPGGEPVSLTELCVRSICRRLSELGSFPSELPREVVDALLDSLTQHQALSSYTLGAFRNCEVTRLSLGGCRGVRNGWVRRLLGDTPCGRSITWLDLSTCTGLTDTGLSQLPALRNLEAASLRHCVGLGAEATLCLSNSPCLETLSLAHCPLLDDAAMENLARLSKLRSLEIEGCENITDRGLRVASGLPSLTCLNASRCRGITVEGLACLSRAAPRLRRLNLGWCPGLAANRNRSGGVEGRRAGGVGGGIGRGGGENDDDDDDEEDDEDDLDVDGAGRGQLWEGGQQQRQVEIEGEEEKWDDGGRGRRREWALPPLPRLEDLCLARSGIGDSGLSQLAAESPNLTTLELSNCLSITSIGAEELSALKKLERVDLSRCRLVASISAGMSKSVRTLNLAETAVRDEEVQTMSRELTGLTALNLDRCDVGDTSLRALSSMTQLERLNLADTGVTDAGMVHLATLTRLKDLNLFFCSISDSGLTSLTTLTGLKRLNLDTRDVGDAGMVQLTSLRLLETLDVFSSSVTDSGVAEGLSWLPSLTSLEICSGRLTDRGLLHLSRVRTLTRLNVSQNQGITAAGLRYIGSMTRLRELNLSSCSITPASLDSLAGLVKLESLAVFGCRLGVSDLERLRGKMPNLKVVRAA
ncbi:unnamed protein product [Ascophyllum nodosum]